MSMIEEDSVGSDEMIVHPAFDPLSCLWFLETGEEAKTITELKSKLPPNTKIVGYFPNGYDGKLVVSGNSTRSVYRERPLELAPKQTNYNPKSPANLNRGIGSLPQRSGVRLKSPQQVSSPKKPVRASHKTKYDHNAILNLWARGKTGPQIATELGIADWKKVCQIVAVERNVHHDPRAISRKPP